MLAWRKTKADFGRFAVRCLISTGSALLLCLLPGVAAAQAGPAIQMSLQPTLEHAPQLPPALRISGQWDDSCPPQLLGSTIEPPHIDIVLHAASGPCSSARRSFSIGVNPALNAGWNTLPAGIYETRVWLERGNGARDLIAFNVIDAGPANEAVLPENGFWWSTIGNDQLQNLLGSGVNLERQGDQLAITLLAWEHGVPTWYFGNTRLRGATASVPLLRMRDGDEPFQPGGGVPMVEAGPQLDLQFTGPAQARAWLSQPRTDSGHGIQLHEWSLARIAFQPGEPGAALSGRWILQRGDSKLARIVDFSLAGGGDANAFRLSEADSDMSLVCRLAEDASSDLPTSCSLREHGAELAQFDHIGLDRLNGHATLDQQPVQLLRVPH